MIQKPITARHVYWSITALLCVVQLVFTLHSRSQLRYEELAESVRNVLWLEHRTIYDGVSSNVGWYGTLLIVYKIFGFSLHAAKFVRFGLACASLVALATVLLRFFEARVASLLLLVIGLSPTLLYFNTLQTSFGIDLQYAPIVLFLILRIDLAPTWTNAVNHLLLGSVAMIAWMSYPTFVFYLPSFAILYCYLVFRGGAPSNRPLVARSLFLGALGFVVPLMIALAYLKQPRLLLFDPAVRSGIFRGGGSASLSPLNIAQGIFYTSHDMFYRANSYYFELARVDFSDRYPLFAVALVLCAGIVLMVQSRSARLPYLSAWTLFICTAIGAHLGLSDTPGMRRSTGMLAAVYALAALDWYQVCYGDALAMRGLKRALAASLLAVLFHHAVALPRNYAALPIKSPYQRGASPFFSTGDHPSQSLDAYVQQALSADLRLECRHWVGECRYAEIYAAVAGRCLWNRLPCHKLLGYDEKTGQFIPLSIALWENYYWKH